MLEVLGLLEVVTIVRYLSEAAGGVFCPAATVVSLMEGVQESVRLLSESPALKLVSVDLRSFGAPFVNGSSVLLGTAEDISAPASARPLRLTAGLPTPIKLSLEL